MSALRPQKQLGTPPMRGQKMAAIRLSGFRILPSGKKFLLFFVHRITVLLRVLQLRALRAFRGKKGCDLPA